MRFLLPRGSDELERREAQRALTDSQIEEAKKLVSELSGVKDQLVRQANGALVELKLKGVVNAGDKKG